LKSYNLALTRQAEAVLTQIAKKEPRFFKRISNVLDGLEQDPFEGKPLKGKLKGLFSYRVGSYRIIYRIFQDRLLIIVIDIGHRRDIYR
jgi:mRNA interferase RelE/StbE